MTILAYVDGRLTHIDRRALFPYRKKIRSVGLTLFRETYPIHVVHIDNYGNISALLKGTAVYLVRSMRMYKDIGGQQAAKNNKRSKVYNLNDIEIWESLVDEGALTEDDCEKFLSTLRDFYDSPRITEYQQRLRALTID